MPDLMRERFKIQYDSTTVGGYLPNIENGLGGAGLGSMSPPILQPSSCSRKDH